MRLILIPRGHDSEKSNVLERSVSKAPNTLPPSIDLFHFSNKAKRHYWVLNPFLKPYWYFEKISSKKFTFAFLKYFW